MGAESANPGMVNPYVAGVGAATGIIGTGLQAYGSYKQSQEAQRQYELMVKAWQAEQERQARLDADNRTQQAFTDALTSANYGQGVEKDAGDAYGTYAKQYGL